MNKPEVYIHAGLGRAGSTFLQYRVFPKFKGLYYIQRTRFRKAGRIIAKGRHDKYFISAELDIRLIEDYLKKYCIEYSHAKPIFVIRRHDGWIASQYRRLLKSGNHWEFTEFFDLENDKGYWKKDSLLYYPVIELLEKYFEHKPRILLYDDLRKDPEAFVQSIADYANAGIDLEKINFSPKHASYKEKQLRTVYTLSGHINLRKKHPFSARWKNIIRNLGVNIIRYSVLYLTWIIPGSLLTRKQLFPDKTQLAAIREAYEEDWQKCIEYSGWYSE